LVSVSTWACAVPDPPDGWVVVLVGLGVAVWLGFGEGLGVRVASRLGSVVLRVGFGLVAFGRVGVALGVRVVRRGVDDGLLGRVGVRDASSVTEVTGLSWLVGFSAPVSRSTNHPMPISRTSADSEARTGPATPLPSDRLWFVMVCSLAHLCTTSRPARAALHEALTKSCV